MIMNMMDAAACGKDLKGFDSIHSTLFAIYSIQYIHVNERVLSSSDPVLTVYITYI